jgi:hypothetical protein
MRELGSRCIRFCNHRAIRHSKGKHLIGNRFSHPQPADVALRTRVSAFDATALSSNAEIVSGHARAGGRP